MGLISISRKRDKKAKKTSDLPDLGPVESGVLKLSDAARERILVVLADAGQKNGYLRVGIKGGGCSGFSYHYAVESKKRESDAVFTNSNARVCVDPKSLKLIGGSWLDYYTDLGSSGFRIINPNSKKSCSCGQSFSL